MNTTLIHRSARPRVSLVFTQVRHCECCDGKSNMIVNGHHVCGKCLKAGRVLDMLWKEQVARQFRCEGTVVFCNNDLPTEVMDAMTARALNR